MSEEPKTEEMKKPAPKGRRVTVAVMYTRGQSAVVRWTERGKLKAVIVPAEQITDGTIAKTALDAGIVYGVPWENVEFAEVSSADLAEALRGHDIWTHDDLCKKPSEATSAIRSLFGVDFATLMQLAIRHEQKEK